MEVTITAPSPPCAISDNKTENYLDIKRILLLAETIEKPNFTQLQLLLQERQALSIHYKQLREIMEKRFNIKPLDI